MTRPYRFCLRQFSLCTVMEGNRLNFREAMTTETSQQLYYMFCEKLKQQYDAAKIQGAFDLCVMRVCRTCASYMCESNVCCTHHTLAGKQFYSRSSEN